MINYNIRTAVVQKSSRKLMVIEEISVRQCASIYALHMWADNSVRGLPRSCLTQLQD